jgi:hypothetical protein
MKTVRRAIRKPKLILTQLLPSQRRTVSSDIDLDDRSLRTGTEPIASPETLKVPRYITPSEGGLSVSPSPCPPSRNTWT